MNKRPEAFLLSFKDVSKSIMNVEFLVSRYLDPNSPLICYTIALISASEGWSMSDFTGQSRKGFPQIWKTFYE